MTATATTASRPSGAFASVLNAAVSSAATSLEETTSRWTDKLEDLAGGGSSSGGLGSVADAGLDEVSEGGGAKAKAGTEGVKAGLHGKNPVWAAIKGAWSAGSPAVRAAIVTAVVSTVLLLVLSPVLLLVFLLSLLVFAALAKAMSSKKKD